MSALGKGGGSAPENQKRLKHCEGLGLAATPRESDWFAFNCASAEFGKFYRHPPASGCPRPPGTAKPRFSPLCPQRKALSGVSRSYDRARPCWVTLQRCPSVPGMGRNCPGGSGRGAEHPPHPASLLWERCLASAGTAGRWENCGSPAEKARSRRSGKATCSREASRHGDCPSCCPPRSQRPPPPRSTAASPGTPGTPLPSRPSLNSARSIEFFSVEPGRGAGAGTGRGWALPRRPGSAPHPGSALAAERTGPGLGDAGRCPRGLSRGRSGSSPAPPDLSCPFSLVKKVLESCWSAKWACENLVVLIKLWQGGWQEAAEGKQCGQCWGEPGAGGSLCARQQKLLFACVKVH